MITNRNQKQEGAEKSTNLQAKQITVNQGISYNDAKEIAKDVFRNNFLELSQKAMVESQERANKLIDDFLEKLEKEKPESINSIESPSMQYALFTAQKEYAKTEDKELSDILVDLLVERADKDERSLIQIVLDESIEVSSKLTRPQFDILSIVFLIKYTMNYDVKSYKGFEQYLNTYYVPLCDNLTENHSDYQHLEYANCTSNLIGLKIENWFKDNYAGVFQKGLLKEDIELEIGELSNDPNLFIPCFHNEKLLQINAMNSSVLDEIMNELDLSLNYRTKIESFFSNNTMPDNEILERIIGSHPKMEQLTKVWNSIMKEVNLTSVGIALARANIKRKTKKDIDLSIWIK